jgi:hypothetical protein
VPAQLPGVVSGFVGRVAELAVLDAALAAADRPRLLVVSGTAGVGKTALATHWAHRVRDRFPDGQLHLDLRGFAPGGAVPTAEAVRAALDALQVPADRVPTSAAAQAGLLRSLLADRQVLLVLDNARDAEQVRPLLPGTPGCLVLVTSRNPLPGLAAIEGARPVPLDLLDGPAALRLLAGRIGADRVAAEPAAADRLVARCAGLPLALAVVAGRATTTRRSRWPRWRESWPTRRTG